MKSLNSCQVKLKKVLYSLCFLVLAMTSAVQASTPAAELEALLAGFSHWSSEFSQIVTDADGKMIQEIEGELVLAKPLKFYWRTYDPFPQKVISDGETLWIYDQDLDQVIIRPLNQEFMPTPAALLSGNLPALSSHYSVKLMESDTHQHSFHLEPLGDFKEGDFESLRLHFSQNSLSRLELFDAFGQKTILEFRDQKKDPKIKMSLFYFQIPMGVDVMDERVDAGTER